MMTEKSNRRWPAMRHMIVVLLAVTGCSTDDSTSGPGDGTSDISGRADAATAADTFGQTSDTAGQADIGAPDTSSPPDTAGPADTFSDSGPADTTTADTAEPIDSNGSGRSWSWTEIGPGAKPILRVGTAGVHLAYMFEDHAGWVKYAHVPGGDGGGRSRLNAFSRAFPVLELPNVR